MRLGIGIPTSHGFPIPADFWKSYDQMADHLRSGNGGVSYFEKVTSDGFPVDVARNQIVRHMLGRDLDALLFLDADHIMPRDLVARLAALDKDVVTARYHVRRPPFHANAYVKHPLAPPGQFKTVHYGQGCFEIDRGGAGALLIKRHVLEAMTTVQAGVSDRERWRRGEWFRYQRNPNPGEPADFSVSEDFWFYEQAQAAGFTCWVDWETEVQHLATIPVGREHNDVYLEAMAAEMTPDLAAQLVAIGFDDPIEVGGCSVMPWRADGVAEERTG